MLCMNSVVNFVVVKLINKPAIQKTLENTIFVDNKRAREQTNVLSKETETVVLEKKHYEKTTGKTCALNMYLPIYLATEIAACAAGTASFSCQKTT